MKRKLFPNFDQNKRANTESVQHTSGGGGSGQPNGTTSIPDDQLDREKLDESMRDVSQALSGTRDITGKHLERNTKAYRYKQVATNVVQRLSSFIILVENIADAHPYSKMAFAIISGVANVITYTQDVDQNMLDLFETLDSTYKFIEDTKDIENHASYKRILLGLAKQTVDCAYFIRDYAKVANFWARVGRNVIGGPIKTRVQMYQDAFSRLLAEFRTHSTLHTEIAVGRLLEWNQDICEILSLDGLPYATGAGLNTGKQCLAGTRVEVLDEIVDWINDADDSCPRLFWLAGQAGVGKSAIAHSIALRFKSIRRLGSFFCFDQNYSVERRREKIFSTIARDLADMDTQIKHELAKIIKDETSLRSTTDLHLQWKNFLFQPLHATSEVSTGPILIVIDALDESGDPRSRQDILKVLEEEISALPANVRFLVTSRPERDIMLTFGRLQPHIRIKMMDTVPESESKRDILTYFKTSLHEEPYFGDVELRHLVNLSQGLFQWAHLASQFLKGLGASAGLTVSERYEDLINTQHIRSINGHLDSMYDHILSSLFDSDDPRVMARFHSVIGSIITALEPLSLNSLVALRGQKISASAKETDIKTITQHMGSLLSGINDPSSTIRPLHSSFRDYLLNPNRRKGLSVNISQCHHDFAFGCIRTMMEGLRFNICDIPDSHKLNADDEGLSGRIESSISVELSYSSRFWALHVSSTAFDPALARNVDKFLHHGFLMWLEVMSLLQAVNVTAKLMSGLISWSSSGKESHETLYDFAVDGKRFIRLFGEAIAKSAPHVYLSALPFCPQDSIIYKTFISQFPNTLQIASRPIGGWPSVKYVLDMAGIGCNCISFAHGGEYLAFTEDNVLTILESETFNVLWAEDIPADILAIEFSPGDKTLVVATQMKIYLFDIIFGGLTLWREFEFGQGLNSGRTVFSWDIKYIASLSNSELSVWYLETKEQEKIITIPFKNECYPTFEFSNSDNNPFVTYVPDVGAQVWDLGTGTALYGPLQPSSLHITTHRHQVSPSGKHIIFIDDVCLYIWNFTDDSLITLDPYPSRINKLSISPNGEYLIATYKHCLTMCNLNGNGEPYYDKRYVDSGWYVNTAFSKDGKYLLFQEERDCGFGICELDEWQSDGSQFSTEPRDLKTVSSDGNLLLVGSKDYDYEIWDVELEQPILELPADTYYGLMTPIFSPLNQYIGYIDYSHNAIVYDIHSGIIQEFPIDDDDNDEPDNNNEPGVQNIAFSKDEIFIATLELTQGRIQIWDIASSQKVDTITIPKVTIQEEEEGFYKFAASPNLQYFAYVHSKQAVKDSFSLISHAGPIPVNLLTDCDWEKEDFSFNLNEEYVLISCELTILHFHLLTKKNRAVALQRDTQKNCLFQDRRYIHFETSSDAVLVNLDFFFGCNIWDAFSGQLLHSVSLEHPERHLQGFIPVHRYLFNFFLMKSHGRILALELKGDAQVCFSSNEQHRLRGLPPGSSARLREDGWVITQNEKLLFWVPRDLHETLHLPKLKFIVGGESTKLDLSSYSHGKSWSRCRINGKF